MKFNKNLFNLKKPLLVGICNFTPDSFSDGGKTFSRTSALNHINSMVKDGAQIIDIGAESTRPIVNQLHTKKKYVGFQKFYRI